MKHEMFHFLKQVSCLIGFCLGLTLMGVAQPNPIKIVKDNGQGTGTTTWHQDTTYLLKGRIFVHPGDTLTIEPGTVIKAAYSTEPEEVVVLSVAVGGHIRALGSPTDPIIFTSELDDLNNPYALASTFVTGLWGGIFLNGNACTDVDSFYHEGIIPMPNTPAKEALVRFGKTNGMCDDTYNAGIFKYVSIRYAGAQISPQAEPNALSIAGLGSGTELHHVEVSFCADDGFEFMGGNVCASYLLAAGVQDDCFDFDLGNRSAVQFIVGVMGGVHGGNRGIEIDGNWQGEFDTLLSKPVIYNATLVSLDSTGNRIGVLRQNAEAVIRNSVFYGFETLGIRVEAQDNDSIDTYRNLLNGKVELNCNLIWEVVENDSTRTILSYGDLSETKDSTLQDYFWSAQNYMADPMFTNLSSIDSLDLRPLVGSPLLTSPCTTLSFHPCIINTGYIGAFQPTNIAFKNMGWADAWTWTSGYYYNQGLATDVDPGLTKAKLTIGPNPLVRGESLSVSWEQALPQVQVSVYDLTGKELMSSTASGHKVNIATDGLASGVYLLRVEHEQQNLGSLRFVVQ